MSSPLSLRQEHRDATRGALVGAARRLFAANGFSETSIDAIATEARVTKGAVYHHFRNKQELFRAVYLVVETEVDMASGVAAAKGRSPIDSILRGVDAYLDAAMANDVQRITLVDAPAVLGPEPNGNPNDNPGHVGLREVINDAVKAGSIKRVDGDSLAHLIRGGCLQAATLIARSNDQGATRKKVGATLRTLIRGLEIKA